MASKKTVRESEGQNKRRDAKAVLRLSRRARAELAELIKRDQAGTITRVEMETGLEELEEQLQAMILFMNKLT